MKISQFSIPVSISRPFVCATVGYLTLLSSSVFAQTTVNYTDTQTDATSYDTTTPNNPTTLNIDSGTATQSGAVIGSGAVIKTGAGTLILSSASNSFSGGATIKAGALISSANSNATLGSGAITIGDSANTGASATLNMLLPANQTFANSLATAGNGINTLNLANFNATFSGGLALGSGLVLSTTNTANSILTLSGAISGTGNLTTQVGGTNANSSIVLSNASINPVGSITNSGTGTGVTLISGIIGSNVTDIVQNSATSALTLSNSTATANAFTGNLKIQSGTVNLSGTNTNALASTSAILLGTGNSATTLNISQSRNVANTLTVGGTGTSTLRASDNNPTYSGSINLSNNLTIGTVAINGSTFTVSSGITGTGNLSLQSNGTLNSGKNAKITVSGSVNNVGSITNNGTGSLNGNAAGALDVTISGNIGSNVTSVVQNSVTSGLVLSGTNSFTGGVVVKAGTLNVQGAGLGVSNLANVGTITLGDSANTGLAATLNASNNLTGATNNPINVVGTGTRTISVTSFNPNFTGAVTLNSTSLNLVTNNTGGSDLTISGGITGAGNLVLQSNAVMPTGKNSRVVLSTGTVNNTGTITNSGTGTVAGTANIDTTISANIGANVTNVIQNSAASALILSGTNSYTGTTSILAGKLQTMSSGNLGLGNVTVAAGATLTLGNFSSINDGAALIVANSSVVNLSFTTTAETVGSLFNSTSNAFIPAGTYDIATLNSTYFGGGSTFAGTGTLTVLSAVPEPATWGLLASALSVVAIARRRKFKV